MQIFWTVIFFFLSALPAHTMEKMPEKDEWDHEVQERLYRANRSRTDRVPDAERALLVPRFEGGLQALAALQTVKNALENRAKEHLPAAQHLIIGGDPGSGKSYAIELIEKALNLPRRNIKCNNLLNVAAQATESKTSYQEAMLELLRHEMRTDILSYPDLYLLSFSKLSVLFSALKQFQSARETIDVISRELPVIRAATGKMIIAVSEVDVADFVEIQRTLESSPASSHIGSYDVVRRVRNPLMMQVLPLSADQRIVLFKEMISKFPGYTLDEDDELFQEPEMITALTTVLASRPLAALIVHFANQCTCHMASKSRALSAELLYHVAGISKKRGSKLRALFTRSH